MVFQRAEPAGEGDLLPGRQGLSGENRNLMLEKRLADGGKGGVIKGLGQIDAGDACAEVFAQFGDGDHV